MTGTSSVHVMISLGDSIPGNAARNIIVRPRTGWTATAMGLLGTAKLQTGSLSPKGGPWGSRDWGRYVAYRMSSLDSGTISGSGPWEGTSYLSSMPSGLLAGDYLYAHPDLYSDGPGYPVPSNGLCDGQPDGDSANVFGVNGVCGSASALSSWRERVEWHERRHRDSYNQCVRSGGELQDKISELEAVFGLTAAEDAEKIWNKMKKILLRARKAGLGPETSPDGMWHWRRWKLWTVLQATTKGHGGQWGCP